ncbi:hypothetical protein BJ875DRAFT_522835, partial [Amylocarpus encephaloides]
KLIQAFVTGKLSRLITSREIKLKSTPCDVCLEEVNTRILPAQLSPKCDHAADICTTCITESINAQIQASPNHVSCPKCPAALDYEVVKLHASPEGLQRYEKHSIMSAFKDDPNFVMCLGPSCQYGQLHEFGAQEPIVSCHMCNFQTCFIHKGPWHSGKTCAEFDAQYNDEDVAEQEKASDEYLERYAKSYPNCQAQIQKTAGCDHMTCRQCRAQFCWLCLAPWMQIMQSGNHHHCRQCRHYRPPF